jgi:hypothetical protein
MIGLALGGWFAHAAFWALLIWSWEEFWPTKTIAFVLLWIAGYIALTHLTSLGLWFMPYVAVLDLIMYVMMLARGYGSSSSL